MNVMCMDSALSCVLTQKEATNVVVSQGMVWSQLTKRHVDL